MSNRRKIVILLVVVVACIGLMSAASRAILQRAAPENSGVIFSQNYTLDSIRQDALVVVADTVNLANSSYIEDDAALVGRSEVTLSGRVDGDLTALGSDVNLDKNGVVVGDASLMGNSVIVNGEVGGDLTVIADTLTINPNTHIFGDITVCATHLVDERSNAPAIERCSEAESAKFTTLRTLTDAKLSLADFSGGMSSGNLLLSLIGSLVLTGLAALAVTAFPRPFSYLSEAVQTVPRRMAGMGCLTSLFAAGGGAVMVFLLAKVPVLGLLLLPVSAILGLLLLGMVIVGWITLALVIGSWVVHRSSRRAYPPLVAVALGSIVLFLVWNVLALLPFGQLIALVLIVTLGCVGLGAAFTTRIGTRSLHKSYFVQG